MEDEKDLLLAVNNSGIPYDENRTRYIEIDEGAKAQIPDELSSIETNELGTSRYFPAPFGEVVITENWEVQLLDVKDPGETWIILQEYSA